MQTTAEIREGFLSFFEERGHMRFPSWSLIPPPEDPSTLFISAGMQPLKPYFSGAKEPPAPRFTTVQKVLRAGGKDTDLEEVGLTARHASMFEMLGNFSFGDYFKDGAIDFAYEFVTEQMGLEHDRLWASVFAGDPELGLGEDEIAVEGWLRKGLPRERIIAFPRKDNFWGPAGETGPCGPCSELHYDRGEEFGCGKESCGPNCDSCDRFIEFWNLVFMEYDLHADGTVTPLPKQNIDTGAGLERVAALLQGVHSVYEADVFRDIISAVEGWTGARYTNEGAEQKALRVLADHGRSMTMLAADGVIPSNESRGYILRRIIRRAVQHGSRIGLESPFLGRLQDLVVEQLGPFHPALVEHRDDVRRLLEAEEQRFNATLQTGSALLDDVIERTHAEGRATIAAADAFMLHDTYGFPVELTAELAHEAGLGLDEP
ncbi:MAG: alanine--tRNA ligase, partial [Gaiellaceae bacterium]